MPPRKLEGENPNGFRSRTASKPGSSCGATGFRGGRVAHRPWGQVVLRPHPLPSLYRGPGDPWGAIRGVGSPTWTPQPPKPSHRKPAILESWTFHLEGIPSPWCAPTSLVGQGSLGGLPPKDRGAGEWVVLP